MKTKILIIVSALIALVLGVMIYQGGVSVSPQPGVSLPEAEVPVVLQPPADFPQENITLSDASGGDTFGGANRYAKGGKFYVGILVEKLLDPTSGQFYEGWLLREDEKSEPLSLGPLTKKEEGDFAGAYVLGYAVEQDLRKYNKILVTLETVNDGKIETVILEGSFLK